ncbi:hypothetical protein CLG96_04880 [Sphingomonas oleivorans]|uniref:DUF1491 domain-containing protein n=1 Tax=Sphingomonas oleivorans TaxID=1735121 RepID=A0A2T5G2Q6_9SPHN|nr:DUF1491 family protein [Sphingomonas oleivorans]PTQ13429.1 hypothetical protein CLG96_04880 [Sphingomonas oleivorans]
MTPRATAGLLVSALIRRIEAEGGNAMVLAKGDATAGAILIVLAARGVVTAMLERVLGPDGYAWTATGPSDPSDPMAVAEHIAKRRRFDPDLWVVELDAPDAERIAREVLAG